MTPKSKKIVKILCIIPIFIGFVFLLSFIVMQLWNNILVSVIGVKQITIYQSLGIFVLCKILFGGFGFRNRMQNRMNFKQKMKEKFSHLTEEERQKMKEEFRKRFQ